MVDFGFFWEISRKNLLVFLLRLRRFCPKLKKSKIRKISSLGVNIFFSAKKSKKYAFLAEIAQKVL